MNLIRLILEVIGFGWIVQTIFIGIFGGSVKVIIKNPLTKNMDTITDILIDR